MRIEVVPRRADQAFEQVAARAADVEEPVVAIDGINDRPPCRLPACLVPPKPDWARGFSPAR